MVVYLWVHEGYFYLLENFYINLSYVNSYFEEDGNNGKCVMVERFG